MESSEDTTRRSEERIIGEKINNSNPVEDTSPTELLTIERLDEARIPTNVWAILIFIGYIIIGISFYSLGPRKLSALDSVYLAVITFSTVGYGDIYIHYRYFACFYVLLGVAVVGTFFGIFSNDIMDAQEAAMQKRLVRVVKSVDTVFVDSARQLNEYGKKRVSTYLSQLTANETELENQNSEAKQEAYVSEMKKASLQAYDEELREIRSKGIVDFLFILVAIFSGCFCMMLIEGWIFEQGLYWAIVTVTTVGYGDVAPVTDLGKIFTIFYVIIGCSFAAKGMRDFVCYPLVLRAKENETKIIEQFGEELSERTLRAIISSDLLKKVPRLQYDAKQMTKSEFVVLVLRLMNKIQEKDILLASQIFDRLDFAQDGVLSESDQADQIARARMRDRERTVELQRKLAEEQQQHNKGNIAGVISQLLVSPTTSSKPSYDILPDDEIRNPMFSSLNPNTSQKGKFSDHDTNQDEDDDPFARKGKNVTWGNQTFYSPFSSTNITQDEPL